MLNDGISGSSITALRETLGETRVQFASRIGTNSESVRRWEREEATPTGPRKDAIATLLYSTPLRKDIETPNPWTSADLNALQEKLGIKSTQAFAKRLGVSDRIIVKWRANNMPLMPSSLKALNRVYRQVYGPKVVTPVQSKAPAARKAAQEGPVEVTQESVRALRERYGDTTKGFGRRFNVSGSSISNWETKGPVPQKHHAKLLAMMKAVAEAQPGTTRSDLLREIEQHAANETMLMPPPSTLLRSKSPTPDKAKVAVEGIMTTVQSFKDKRAKTLIDEALTHVASELEFAKPQLRKAIATFLYLVYEEVPLHVILSDLTGHGA